MSRNSRKTQGSQTGLARGQQTTPIGCTALLLAVAVLVVILAICHALCSWSVPNEVTLEPVPAVLARALNALVMEGNLSALKSLLNSHPHLNWHSLNMEQSPIHVALQGRFESLSAQSQTLVGQHEEIISYFTHNRRWKPAGCPIYYAAFFRNMRALRLLLLAMGDEALSCLTARDATGVSALQNSASSKASGFARFFARAISDDGHVIEHPDPAVAALLGLSNTPPGLTSSGQLLTFSSLTEAILHTDFDIIVSHFGPRLDLSSVRDVWGNTLLHTAAYAGRRGLVQFLIKREVPVTAKNMFGQTPRLLAELAGHSDVSELLASDDEVISLPPQPHDCSQDKEETRPHQLAWDLYTNSGWTSHEQAKRTLRHFPSCSCQLTMMSVENMTSAQFSELVVSQHTPVLLQGLTSHWPAWTNWRKQHLVRRFGHLLFTVTPIPYADQYISSHKSFSQQTLSLKQYLESFPQAGSAPAYLFDGKVLESSEVLASNVPPLELLSNRHVYLRQFIVGPRNSGAPPHFHGQAVNSLVYGIKQWFFWRPSLAFFSFKHVSAWKKEYNSTHSPPLSLTCLQLPGETVYIPENWGHAVINREDSIAVAMEFT